MDQDKVADDAMMFCAACGIRECDDITLKTCNACKSVRYCGVECQKNHRPQHKRACRKRAAELRDELLFTQPESSYLGDCPICMIPLPLDLKKSTMMTCCSKVVCRGCDYANAERGFQAKLVEKCPFCRKPKPSDKEAEENVMKRIEANDPVAMRENGSECYKKGDYSSAFEYFTKAAKLGDVLAHHQLSICYALGRGVEKDEKKEIFHWEEAAIGGHPNARYNLGNHEWRNGRIERSMKHYSIAAGQGHDGAIKALKRQYTQGTISKENFAASLRAHQAALDGTKSPQREVAEEYYRSRGQNRC
jgi:tetratricopeptide (TPR) repeat protein